VGALQLDTVLWLDFSSEERGGSMYELLYTSLAVRDYSDGELNELLQEARGGNARLSVTGMLIYYDREIAQLLEGEEKVIKRLFEKIEADPRHMLVETLFEGPIEKRAFGGWSMAFRKIREEDRERLSQRGIQNLESGSSFVGSIKSSPNVGKRMLFQVRDLILKSHAGVEMDSFTSV